MESKKVQASVIKRLSKEIDEVNSNFDSLRTWINADPDGRWDKFYFTMVPNDGLFAHKKVIGRFFIPESYPFDPPVVHMLTLTKRYNIDIYRYNLNNENASSMCFDILRTHSATSSTWNSDLTLSILFSTLMQTLVSFLVEQDGGHMKPEFVSMSKLNETEKAVTEALKKYGMYIKDVPEIPIVNAKNHVSKNIAFSETEFTINPKSNKTFVSIDEIVPGETDFHFTLNLAELYKNPDVVVSLVMTTNEKDLIGKNKETCLVRNGVTGTAAIKTPSDTKSKWFYHGIPFHKKDLQITLTISKDQFTISYFDKGQMIVHGDAPVTKLDKKTLKSGFGQKFKLCLFLKNTGKNVYTCEQINTDMGFVC